jgi:hypothetical protein
MSLEIIFCRPKLLPTACVYDGLGMGAFVKAATAADKRD